MTAGIEGDLNQLRGEVAHLRADLGRIAETLQNLARHGVSDAKGQAQKAADSLESAVKAKAGVLTEEIEAKPLTAALVSFAIGAFLGSLLRGGRS